MDASVWVINLAILASVMISDLGTRRIGPFRLLKPVLIVATVVAAYVEGAATSGHGLILELASTAAGLGLGALAAAQMRVGYDPGQQGAWLARRFGLAKAPGRAVSHAGLGYLLIWVLVVGGRLYFAWGSQHQFGAALGRWMVINQISSNALVDSLIFLSIAMVVTRTAILAGRARVAIARGRRAPAQAAPLAPVRVS